MIEFFGCPHCNSKRFIAGPRGGSAQNLICTQCSARYNVAIPPQPAPLLLLEVLRHATGEPAHSNGAYIIELPP